MTTPTTKPRKPEFEARRREIVDMAAHLFAQQGYAATGIREIGDAAQLGRGALYYYIESKESLLGEIHDRVMDPLLTKARELSQVRSDPEQGLRAVSQALLDLILERREHVWVFLHEYRSLTGDRRDVFRRKRRDFEAIITDMLQAGVDAGEFAIEDVRGAMLAFLGMHNYTYQWAHDGMVSDATTLSRVYCDLFFTGVAKR